MLWLLIYFGLSTLSIWVMIQQMATALGFGEAGAFGLVTVFLLVSNASILVMGVRRWFSKNLKVTGVFVVTCATFLSLNTVFGYSMVVNRQAVIDMQSGGDQILMACLQFEEQKGRYPNSLRELEETGFVLPEPRLRNSKYELVTTGLKPEVQFRSRAFQICTANSPREWVCED